MSHRKVTYRLTFLQILEVKVYEGETEEAIVIHRRKSAADGKFKNKTTHH
jgi:hypothetical protein